LDIFLGEKFHRKWLWAPKNRFFSHGFWSGFSSFGVHQNHFLNHFSSENHNFSFFPNFWTFLDIFCEKTLYKKWLWVPKIHFFSDGFRTRFSFFGVHPKHFLNHFSHENPFFSLIFPFQSFSSPSKYPTYPPFPSSFDCYSQKSFLFCDWIFHNLNKKHSFNLWNPCQNILFFPFSTFYYFYLEIMKNRPLFFLHSKGYPFTENHHFLIILIKITIYLRVFVSNKSPQNSHFFEKYYKKYSLSFP